MGEAELADPALVVVDLVLDDHRLEERAADHHRLVAQHLELPAQVRGDVRRAPAELDDVDVDAACLENVFPGVRAEALVEDVRQSSGSRFKAQQ